MFEVMNPASHNPTLPIGGGDESGGGSGGEGGGSDGGSGGSGE